MKKQFGQQIDYFDLYQIAFGQDYYWWWVPTHPELKTNYLEKVWSKREIREQRRADQFEKDEDDSDPDKKLFSQEVKRSRMEKRIVGVVIPMMFVAWMVIGQDFVLKNLYSDEGQLLELFREAT